jgi:hypothetical protein
MEKLSEKNKKEFDSLLQEIGKTLIGTMDVLEIPNYIDASYKCNGKKYTLRFEKLKK